MRACVIAVSALLLPAATLAQTTSNPAPPALRTQSNVVLIPALVRNAKGEIVFTLNASDFRVTDDGIEQPLQLVPDTDHEPLALVVLIEIGGAGAREFNMFPSIAPPLPPMLESIVGNVPHRLAVVTFDNHPTLLQDFTPSIDQAADAIRSLQPGCGRQHHMLNCAWPGAIHDIPLGDNGAAILDAVSYSVDLLRDQPPNYRRAILMISETLDRGSQTSFDQALRAVTDSDTTIYSVAYSTGKSEAVHYAARQFPNQPGRALLENHKPNPEHGCMGKDTDPDPDATHNKAIQAYDCLTQLAPPLALAKMLAIEATDAMKRNIPEAIARLTGGEYFSLNNPRNLAHDLATISNHVPNRYVLSFQPQSPHPGFHAVELKLKDHSGLRLTARTGYWAVGDADRATEP
jgi:VWFA-related protein